MFLRAFRQNYIAIHIIKHQTVILVIFVNNVMNVIIYWIDDMIIGDALCSLVGKKG